MVRSHMKISAGHDLHGKQVPRATGVDVGICLSGEYIGIDLTDEEGDTFAHCHFDVETAMSFVESLTDLIDGFIGTDEVKH